MDKHITASVLMGPSGISHGVVAGETAALCGVAEEWGGTSPMLMTCPNCRLHTTNCVGPTVTVANVKSYLAFKNALKRVQS